MPFALRHATLADTEALRQLIELSVRSLQREDYSAAQIDRALHAVFGLDTQLIADRTYFVATGNEHRIVGCGGWSRRRTLFGADAWPGREDSLLDPTREAAKIRAFFVHPGWVRRGIGSLILEACESAAAAEGFRRLEMGATLTGVRLYAARGYVEREHRQVELGGGITLPIVRMEKTLRP